MNDAAKTFADEFPERVADALVRVPPGETSAAETARTLLDSDSLRCYHDIQLLKVELEIEAAALLRLIGETVCALTDMAEALQPATRGEPIGLDSDSALARRSKIKWLMRETDRWPTNRGSATTEG